MQCEATGHWAKGSYRVDVFELMFIHTVVDCPNKRARDICYKVGLNVPHLDNTQMICSVVYLVIG
jgi:hypothetical protein